MLNFTTHPLAAPHQPLPKLRQDLGLFNASPDHDGTPAWSLHDPAVNRFYRVEWAAFEILSRWSLGTAAAIVQAVRSETTLQLDHDDVAAVLLFLQQNFLVQTEQAADSQRLYQHQQKQRLHWSRWLLKNYLFFRIPLVQPDRVLQQLTPWFSWLFHPLFWLIMGAFAVLTLFQVARQWEVFSHSFVAYRNWEALLAFGIALSFSKVIHELGHAITCRRFGCQVPAMGIAFLVLWPVLYTDTTEAWKLPSRRARLQIGVAGMAAELCLAIVATWLWFVLPEGPLRAAMFFLATTTWVLTLLINASPFMRFDGYFLLSDVLGIPNLHERSFALGRWWLRKLLFGLNDAPPEHHPKQNFLIIFAVATWLYRLVLFLSIALLVYHFFFKALGIFLMLVEIGWFILRPVLQELQHWLHIRQQIQWNRHTSNLVLVLILLLAGLFIPWQTEVSAPAVLTPLREQNLYASQAARVEWITPKQQLKQGELAVKLYSPELQHRIELARIREAALHKQLEQQNFSLTLQQQGSALQQHWQEARAELDGLIKEQQKLQLSAPFDGEVVLRNDEIHPGSWITPQEMLLTIADTRANKLEALVDETTFARLQLNTPARFISDISENQRIDCQISMLDPVNLSEIDEAILTSLYGGPLAARQDLRHSQPVLQPINSSYRVTLSHCTPSTAAQFRHRGIVTLQAEAQSPWQQIWQQVLRSAFRELGL